MARVVKSLTEASAPPAKRVTRKNVQRVQEQVFLQNVLPLMQEVFAALMVKVKEGNPKALEIAAQATGLIKGTNGVNVVTNIMQATYNQGGDSQESFASIVRKLDEAEKRSAAGSTVLDV